MTLLLQSVPLNTDGTGAVSRDVRFAPGRLHAVAFEIGTLETPDLTLTDEPAGVELLAVTGLADDDRWNLVAQAQGSDGDDVVGSFVAPLVYGRVHVAVAGGGASKTGRLVLFVER